MKTILLLLFFFLIYTENLKSQEPFLWAKHLERLDNIHVTPSDIFYNEGIISLWGTSGDFALNGTSDSPYGTGKRVFMARFNYKGDFLNFIPYLSSFDQITVNERHGIFHVIARNKDNHSDFSYLKIDAKSGTLLQTFPIFKINWEIYVSTILVDVYADEEHLYLGLAVQSGNGNLEIGATQIPVGPYISFHVIKFDIASMTEDWIRTFMFPNSLQPEEFLIAPIQEGRIIISGQYFETVELDGAEIISQSAICSNCKSIFIVHLDPNDGQLSWAKSFIGVLNVNLGDVNISGNKIILAGELEYGQSSFGSFQLEGDNDLFLLHMNMEGIVTSARVFNGPGNIYGINILKRPDDKFYLGWENHLNFSSRRDIYVSLINEEFQRESTFLIQGSGTELLTSMYLFDNHLGLAGTFDRDISFNDVHFEAEDYFSSISEGFVSILKESAFNECPKFLSISHLNQYQDFYGAINSIESNAIIPSDHSLIFQAGGSIQFNNNFYLKPGGQISVFNRSCD